jgi:hypothetical protein
VVSVVWNVIQHRRFKKEQAIRGEERAEQRRREQEAKDEQRRREQAPPKIYNCGGESDPIVISGRRHSPQGPFVDQWGMVTVVNPTQAPIKIEPMRFVFGSGKAWRVHRFFFAVKSDPRDRSERLSLRGNDKEDYEMHFMFPDDQYPAGGVECEVWFSSDNRPEEFSVPVTFV